MVHSSTRSPVDIGTVIAGTYRIEKIIGKGGMGAVFVASHARLPGKQVAIKVLHAEIADSESLARFRREAEIATRLGHPNIVEVHDFNELPDGTPYLVLEFLQGESLWHRLSRGPLSLEQTLIIVRQVGSALAAAHREEIIHRDLKPANVFLVQTETDGHVTERAKVLDFGISKIRGSQTIKTQDSSILGTPQYMAPEQALGNHAAVDARTDVFALGAMVYEMLCGKAAFAGASIPEVVFRVVYEEPMPIVERVPMLDPVVAAAIHRALAKKPEERFADVAGFIEALTGQPLATMKRPLSLAPADGNVPSAATAAGSEARPPSDKISTREAFASTIGSGDHASAMIGTDATVASGNHGSIVPAAPVGPAPSVMTPATLGVAPTVSAPAAGGHGKLIVVALAILAAAAVAIVFLMTKAKDKDKEPAATAPAVASVDAAVPAAASVDAAVVAVAPVDAAAVAAVPVDAAVPLAKVDAAVPKVKIDAGASKPPPEEEPDDEDEGGLAECNQLLGSDPDEAILCANKVLEKKGGVAQAYVIKAKAFCANGDQEGAMAQARRLAGKPRLRKKVLVYCARQGIVFE